MINDPSKFQNQIPVDQFFPLKLKGKKFIKNNQNLRKKNRISQNLQNKVKFQIN